MDFVTKNFDFTPSEPCMIIGEVGVNHNNNPEMLFKLIEEGAKAGIDVIKLQRFNAALEISTYAALADYQVKAGMTDGQLKMAQELELSDELLVKAFDYCKEVGVGFLCTAFEWESVDFLADKLGCKTVKVPSPEISNKPLLQQMAKKFDSLLVSTGASYMEEVEQALDWIREAGGGKNELALMHCTSQYPALLEQANLNAIKTMRDKCGLPTGYSDHTLGHTAAVVMTGLGGAMLEKHFTLDKNLPGPDHQASVDIPELTALVKAVRKASEIRNLKSGRASIDDLAAAGLIDDVAAAQASLGDGVKKPTAEEAETRPKIRKSIVCGVESLKEGDVIKHGVYEIKRPWVEGAVAPYELEKILGKKLKTKKRFDEPILWSDVA